MLIYYQWKYYCDEEAHANLHVWLWVLLVTRSILYSKNPTIFWYKEIVITFNWLTLSYLLLTFIGQNKADHIAVCTEASARLITTVQTVGRYLLRVATAAAFSWVITFIERNYCYKLINYPNSPWSQRMPPQLVSHMHCHGVPLQ